MAKNKIEDLRNHLFLALERLNDEELDSEKVSEEVEKAKAISNIASVIIQSAKIEVDFMRNTGAIETNSEFFKNLAVTKQLN